jgi:DNA-binding transcriptional LysR family regulator
MAKRAPEWHLYRSFLATVREGSLSAASRSLGLTQPTLGRHIEALEASLGLTLFTRSLDGVLPTTAALRLVQPAEAMAAAADAAQRAASGDAAEDRGTVRITASDLVGAEVLPAMLTHFHEQHPLIAFELSLTNKNEDLLRGDADIAIRMDRPTQGALVAKKIGQVNIGLFAHRRYLKRRGTPTRPEHLAGHSLIGSDRDPAAARLLVQWGIDMRADQFSLRADNDLAQLAAIRAGFGIGGLQLGIARRDKALIQVLSSSFMFSLEMWLAMHRDQRTNRRVRLVFDALALSLAEYVLGS